MGNRAEDDHDLYPVMREILRWSRITAIALIGEHVVGALTSDTEKLVYNLSDGKNSSRDISSQVKVVSHKTVTNYWKKWARLGVVEPSPFFEGRWQKVIELEQLGIDLPKLPKPDEILVEDAESTAR